MANEIEPDLLAPLPPQEIRLDLTTRCNLRCVYCAVSQSFYQGTDMPADLAHQATAAILDIARNHKLKGVHINGHGETTFMQGWVDVCKPLLQENLPLMIITNLAKVLSADELEVMSQMNIVAVSIDTADPDLLRRFRRKVDLNRIVRNINAIRETASRLNRQPPHFHFSCGLYDKNSLFIEDLARFMVDLDIKSVGFWNLTKWGYETLPYQNTDVPEDDRVYALDELSDDDLRPRIAAIQRAIAVLSENRIQVDVYGDFVNTLAVRLNDKFDAMANTQCFELQEGMTRDCIDPWNYVEVDTSGDIKPCCARGSIGNLRHGSLSQILNDDPIRRLRADLLYGTPDSECARCRLRSPTAPAALQAKVRALSDELVSQKYVSTFAPDMVEALLKGAVQHLKAGRQEEAWSSVNRALALDPGIQHTNETGPAIIRHHLDRILGEARFPLTLSWLAGISREVGDDEASVLLLKRYLELAPDAPDRDHVARSLATAVGIQNSELSSLEQPWLWLRSKIRLRTRLRAAIKS
jgi:MoaA/NifB/PqqE/SkfB family radical SAM enzyme